MRTCRHIGEIRLEPGHELGSPMFVILCEDCANLVKAALRQLARDAVKHDEGQKWSCIRRLIGDIGVTSEGSLSTDEFMRRIYGSWAGAEPLSAGELLEIATDGKKIPPERALATFAEESNWIKIHEGNALPDSGYTPRACEWAFIGPVRPPYELARNALKI